MVKRAILLTALLGVCFAQAPVPTTPQAISAYYRLPGATTYPYKWLVLDDPLELTVDSNGSPHLGITRAWILVNCVLAADNKSTVCSDDTTTLTAVSRKHVRNEVPGVLGPPSDPPSWVLTNIPREDGASCYADGQRQTPPGDYQLNGLTLTSTKWTATTAITCDYDW